MRNILTKVRQQFGLSDLKGDPLEDVARIILFAVVCCGLGIVALLIKFIIFLITVTA